MVIFDIHATVIRNDKLQEKTRDLQQLNWFNFIAGEFNSPKQQQQ